MCSQRNLKKERYEVENKESEFSSYRNKNVKLFFSHKKTHANFDFNTRYITETITDR